MFEPVHAIAFDRARKLIDVRVGGLITPEDAAWIGEEVHGLIRALGPDVGKHRTLYDVSGLSIAPAETIETVKEMLADPEVRPLWAKKVAIVTGSALGKLQMQRLCEVRGDITLFKDRDEAIAWLLE